MHPSQTWSLDDEDPPRYINSRPVGYGPAVTHKIQLNPIQLYFNSKINDSDGPTILSFTLARQHIVYLSSDETNNDNKIDNDSQETIIPLVNNFYSDLNTPSLDELKLTKLKFKNRGKTLETHKHCQPYIISRSGTPIKIPLVDSSDVSCATLLIWGCYKNKNGLKTLYVNAIIIEDLCRPKCKNSNDDDPSSTLISVSEDCAGCVDVWNEPKNFWNYHPN